MEVSLKWVFPWLPPKSSSSIWMRLSTRKIIHFEIAPFQETPKWTMSVYPNRPNTSVVLATRMMYGPGRWLPSWAEMNIHSCWVTPPVGQAPMSCYLNLNVSRSLVLVLWIQFSVDQLPTDISSGSDCHTSHSSTLKAIHEERPYPTSSMIRTMGGAPVRSLSWFISPISRWFLLGIYLSFMRL